MTQLIPLLTSKNKVYARAVDQIAKKLYMLKIKDGIKTIVFSGTESGVGSTSIATETARAMARSGWKTLLVDADFSNFNTKSSNDDDYGLANYIEQETSTEDIPLYTDEPMLSFLPSGMTRNKPIALLSSQWMIQFIKKVTQQYEFIIFDTPALSCSLDTLILATQTDGIVLVTAFGRSDTRMLRNYASMLKRHQISLLGVVMNRVDKELYSSFQKLCKNPVKKSNSTKNNSLRNTK